MSSLSSGVAVLLSRIVAVSGFSRKFLSNFAPTRREPEPGSKSMSSGSGKGVVNGPAPICVATPVVAWMRYSRLVLPTPYNWPSSGRKSIAWIVSPGCSPLMVMVLRIVLGATVSNTSS